MEGASLLEILIWEGVSLLEILIWVHYKGMWITNLPYMSYRSGYNFYADNVTHIKISNKLTPFHKLFLKLKDNDFNLIRHEYMTQLFTSFLTNLTPRDHLHKIDVKNVGQ
jgi:hypothetical protein